MYCKSKTMHFRLSQNVGIKKRHKVNTLCVYYMIHIVLICFYINVNSKKNPTTNFKQ